MGFPFGDIGPANVYFGSTALGPTEKITQKYKEMTKPHTTAQTGESAKDEYYTGQELTVEIELKEVALATFAAIMGNAEVDGEELGVGNPIGISLRSIAQPLVFKPIVGNVESTDAALWVTIPVAAPVVDGELIFDATTDRMFKATFKCFVVTDVPSGADYEAGKIWYIGLS